MLVKKPKEDDNYFVWSTYDQVRYYKARAEFAIAALNEAQQALDKNRNNLEQLLTNPPLNAVAHRVSGIIERQLDKLKDNE